MYNLAHNAGLQILLVVVSLLVGCTHTLDDHCVALANGHSKLPPCWLLNKPQRGLIREGSKGIGANGWAVTKAVLLRDAMTEFAVARFGEDVSVNSFVVKKVSVTNRNAHEVANTQSQGVYQAVFSTPNNKVNVKAKVEDYFYNFKTEKIYLWITERQ